MKCRKILMIVTCVSKKNILARPLDGEPRIPAAKLLKHPGLEIICDDEAYKEFSKAI